MRSVLAALVLASVAFVVGCSGDEGATARRPSKTGADKEQSATPETAPTPATTSAALAACQAVTAPTALDGETKDGDEIHIAGTAVFYRSGQVVKRVLKNGANKKAVFTSPNLTHAYVDAKGLLLVEQTDDGDPSATLRGFAANAPAEGAPDPAFPEFPVVEGADPGGTTAATNFNAASAKIFAADEDSYYLQADDNDNGNALIVQVNRTTLTQTNIVNVADTVITSPQVAGGAVWWVQDSSRVFKIALATEETPLGTAAEVFGLGPQCNLAVSENTAFCSLGGTIESRDLLGGSPKTVVAVAQSKSVGLFGTPKYAQGKLYLAGSDPDVQSLIRSFSPAGEEAFVACKRAAVRDLAVDQTDVIWAEEGTGLFMVPKN